jgi:hypothetical protein
MVNNANVGASARRHAEPKRGVHYLAKEDISSCDSWGTGSPAEIPGAGGDRDADIPLDPDICPSFY